MISGKTIALKRVKMNYHQVGSYKYYYNGKWNNTAEKGQIVDTPVMYGYWLIDKGYAEEIEGAEHRSVKKKTTKSKKSKSTYNTQQSYQQKQYETADMPNDYETRENTEPSE